MRVVTPPPSYLFAKRSTLNESTSRNKGPASAGSYHKTVPLTGYLPIGTVYTEVFVRSPQTSGGVRERFSHLRRNRKPSAPSFEGSGGAQPKRASSDSSAL